ncbi:TPA: hypothetical protein R2W98_002928 [Escherichia coli]|nr:hypothetical protein [Escherichia coli]
MAITIQCYSESDNEAFFGGDLDHEQLPAPTYDEPKARTGKPPVVIDNRSVRLWLIETGCLSYSQLAEAYPWADDVFTGLSRPSGLSNSGGLPVSKAYLFAALYGTNDIFSRNTDISYTAITGRSPSPRYLRHVNSVLQATAVSLAKVLKDRGDFTWWDYNDKCLS